MSILAWLLYCSSSLSYWTYLSLLHDDINCHRKINEEDNDEMPNTVEDIYFSDKFTPALFCIPIWTHVDLLPTGRYCPHPRKPSGKQNGDIYTRLPLHVKSLLLCKLRKWNLKSNQFQNLPNQFQQYNSVQKKLKNEFKNSDISGHWIFGQNSLPIWQKASWSKICTSTT